MSVDSPNYRFGRREYRKAPHSSAQKIGAPLLAEQQVEAALRELRDKFESAEQQPSQRKIVSEAVGLAWRILTISGFPDFEAIRKVRTEEFPDAIEPSQHRLIALALETIGWHHFGLRVYDIDRTARVFDRALELAPQNQRALERFAIVANKIQPEHIGGFAHLPKKQQETALGYKLQCKRKIDNILVDVFGITEAHLVGQAQISTTELMRSKSVAERRFIFNILGHLSQLNCTVGEFFGNGTQLSLGMGAACCQLEMLDLPRDISNLMKLLKSRLDEANGDEVAGDETPLLGEILKVIADICAAKWRIFQNHGAQRRADEIKDLLRLIRSARSDC